MSDNISHLRWPKFINTVQLSYIPVANQSNELLPKAVSKLYNVVGNTCVKISIWGFSEFQYKFPQLFSGQRH